MIGEIMEWNDVVSKRKNTYNWKKDVPSIELINQIVQEIHQYCPSKQRKIPFYLDILDNSKEYNQNLKLYNLLLENKSSISRMLVEWIDQRVAAKECPFQDYVYDKSKCHRDIGYVISGYANDIRYSSNLSTIRNSRSYWKDGEPQVRQFAEILAHKFIKTQLLSLLNENNITQKFKNKISDLCDIIINVIDRGYSSIPAEEKGQGNIRYEIFEGTDRKGLGLANDIRNPQVLSPYLFVFSSRTLNDNEIGWNREMQDHVKARNVSENEIGITSMFAALSASAKGLDTGFCACIRNGSEIARMLGHKNEQVLLYLGVGYRDDNKKYYCPVIHDFKDIPNRDYDQKPSLEKYYKFKSL
jgi:hypothetical protein